MRIRQSRFIAGQRLPGSTQLGMSVRLLDLELDGHVARLAGQLFQRLARG